MHQFCRKGDAKWRHRSFMIMLKSWKCLSHNIGLRAANGVSACRVFGGALWLVLPHRSQLAISIASPQTHFLASLPLPMDGRSVLHTLFRQVESSRKLSPLHRWKPRIVSLYLPDPLKEYDYIRSLLSSGRARNENRARGQLVNCQTGCDKTPPRQGQGNPDTQTSTRHCSSTR